MIKLKKEKVREGFEDAANGATSRGHNSSSSFSSSFSSLSSSSPHRRRRRSRSKATEPERRQNARGETRMQRERRVGECNENVRREGTSLEQEDEERGIILCFHWST
ncbi:hypothetical protein M0802_005879 [Mischocyttarus mexicanus]|nr:hypothetical protein M0802_005879 [Mischocyttarus mexicanus]